MADLIPLPVIVLGPPGVGKKTILSCLHGRTESDSVFRQLDIDGQSLLLRVQAIDDLQSIPYELIVETKMFVFVFDESNPSDSLSFLDQLFEGLSLLLGLSEESSVHFLLLGNKWDLAGPEVSDQGRQFALSHWDMPFKEVTNIEPRTIEAAFSGLVKRYAAPDYFTLLPPRFSPFEKYIIRLHANPQFALDVRDVSKDPGAKLTIWTHHAQPNQQWLIDPVKKTITSVNSHLVLGIEGENVIQTVDNGSDEQRWEVHVEDGTIRCVNGLVCMDLKGNVQKGTEIGAVPIGRNESQRWDFELLE
jgi:hypothetical protein